MNIFYYSLAALLVLMCLFSIVSGRLFLGRKLINRDDDRKMFYAGLITYLVIAVFSVLFGKEMGFSLVIN